MLGGGRVRGACMFARCIFVNVVEVQTRKRIRRFCVNISVFGAFADEAEDYLPMKSAASVKEL